MLTHDAVLWQYVSCVVDAGLPMTCTRPRMAVESAVDLAVACCDAAGDARRSSVLAMANAAVRFLVMRESDFEGA